MVLLEATGAAALDVDLNFMSELEAASGVNEMVATNYARQNIGSRTITEDDTGNRVILDSADIVFTSLGVSGGGDGNVVGCAIIRNTGGADTTNPLIAVYDLTSTVTNGQNMTIAPGSAGWVAG